LLAIAGSTPAHFRWLVPEQDQGTAKALPGQARQHGLTAATGAQAGEDRVATKLLADTRAARAVWQDFPGFTAGVTTKAGKDVRNRHYDRHIGNISPRYLSASQLRAIDCPRLLIEVPHHPAARQVVKEHHAHPVGQPSDGAGGMHRHRRAGSLSRDGFDDLGGQQAPVILERSNTALFFSPSARRILDVRSLSFPPGAGGEAGPLVERRRRIDAGRESTPAGGRNVELLADTTSKCVVDLALAGHGAAPTVCRVEHARMLASFAHDPATMALAMPKQLLALHGRTAGERARITSCSGSINVAAASLAVGTGRGSG
jgi:hypothetical protein